VLLNSSPAAGFDQPFEMLSACHERMQRSLQLLSRLIAHLAEAGDAPRDREMATSAARDVMRYFDIAAPAHHEDEEQHVFPLVRATGDDELIDAITQLQADHQAMLAAWRPLRALLDGVAQAGTAPDLHALEAAAQAFASLYDEHIALEDSVIFPAARASAEAAGPATLEAIGSEMAQRRGVPR
jgi:hemerythrin-like domain-containing protein